MLDVQIVDEVEMDQRLDAAIRHGLTRCFPADREFFSTSRAWHGSPPNWTSLVSRDDEIIAHVGVVERTILVGNASLSVAGIQNVFVLPELQGMGYCPYLLKATMDEARRRRIDGGLLFCGPSLTALYARCNWQLLDASVVTRVDADGQEKPLAEGNIPMYYPLCIERFPPGPVHLQGNDW